MYHPKPSKPKLVSILIDPETAVLIGLDSEGRIWEQNYDAGFEEYWRQKPEIKFEDYDGEVNDENVWSDYE